MAKSKKYHNSSSTCEDQLLLKNYDLLYCFNIVYLIGHVLILLEFLIIGIPEMVFINIISVLWFTSNAYKMSHSEIEKYVVTEKRMMIEVLLHQIIAFYYVGGQIGFHYILLAFATLMFTLYKDSKGKKYYIYKATVMILIFIILQFCSYYYVPKYEVPDLISITMTISIIAYTFIASSYFTLKSYTNIIESIEEFETELVNKNERIQNIQKQVILSLANIVESRDATTGAHISRTSEYVTALVLAMSKHPKYCNTIDENFINYMKLAAPMHDIGKIKIPDSILLKPGKLTDEEFEIIKTHTTYGGELINSTLEQIEDPRYTQMAFNITMHHHEKWNGKGYPIGLTGEAIPIEARIMALVDVYDALTSERCYKKAFSPSEAYQIIKNDLGTHFDPEIGQIFLHILDQKHHIETSTK